MKDKLLLGGILGVGILILYNFWKASPQGKDKISEEEKAVEKKTEEVKENFSGALKRKYEVVLSPYQKRKAVGK
jgi:hypothetical protein